MNEDRIKNLIRTWHDKSCNEGDQFASFVFIWFSFNAWLEYLPNKQTDREMLNELINKSHNTASLIEAYDAAYASDEFFKRSLCDLVNKSKEEPIKDVRGQRQSISISDENDFINIVEAIYRIRCNLFHGGKDVNDTRDQILVRDAAMILKQWMGKLIDGWK